MISLILIILMRNSITFLQISKLHSPVSLRSPSTSVFATHQSYHDAGRTGGDFPLAKLGISPLIVFPLIYLWLKPLWKHCLALRQSRAKSLGSEFYGQTPNVSRLLTSRKPVFSKFLRIFLELFTQNSVRDFTVLRYFTIILSLIFLFFVFFLHHRDDSNHVIENTYFKIK